MTCHVIFFQFASNGVLVQGPLATWVERETALMMLQHLLLGFELELYQRCELCMIYWCAQLPCMGVHPEGADAR